MCLFGLRCEDDGLGERRRRREEGCISMLNVLPAFETLSSSEINIILIVKNDLLVF